MALKAMTGRHNECPNGDTYGYTVEPQKPICGVQSLAQSGQVSVVRDPFSYSMLLLPGGGTQEL